MKRIDDIDISNKKVFLRVDFNVPLNNMKKIADDTRIKTALPTIEFILGKNASLIIASHLGRPKSEKDKELSLKPVAEHLSSLLKKEVIFIKDCIGENVKRKVSELKKGEILLLENLRFYKEEKANDKNFAKRLAELCDVYINEAFAVSHRSNASIDAITEFVKESGAGFLLMRELEYFDMAMKKHEKPFTVILGGLKVSDKLKAIKNMLRYADNVIIGGAMANTFLTAEGLDMAKSFIEKDLIEEAKSIMKIAKEKNIGFYLPEDVIAAKELKEGVKALCVSISNIPTDYIAFDIGAKTIKKFSEVIANSKTIIWNGPMGVFEITAFSEGTIKIAESVANNSNITIAGGGDTNAAIALAGVKDKISYISTGGGAFLTLMEGKSLPGVDALNRGI